MLRVRKPLRPPAPLERHSQEALFNWAALATGHHPELATLYAIPNAGGFTGGFKKNIARVMAMKREGVKSGVPDVCLPVARGGYHSLYIEMKRENEGTLSSGQKDWAKRLALYGNKVVVAHGFDEAKTMLEEYLSLPKTKAIA